MNTTSVQESSQAHTTTAVALKDANPSPGAASSINRAAVPPAKPFATGAGAPAVPSIPGARESNFLSAPMPSNAASPFPWRWVLAAGFGAIVMMGFLFYIRENRKSNRSAAMAIVAHELKSPLTAIESYLDLMAHEGSQAGSPKELRRWLEDIRQMKSTAAHLRQTIADLLDMTQIESGKIKLALQPLDLGRLAREVTDTFLAQTRQSGLTVRLNAASDLPPITADPDRLRQVLNNLLSNAIKFTPKGGAVEISIQSESNGAGAKIHCRVHDTGIGMDSVELRKLFGKFVRLKPSVSGEEGTGLGLYISKAIIEAHRGKLWAESATGKGSSFHFNLPLSRKNGLS